VANDTAYDASVRVAHRRRIRFARSDLADGDRFGRTTMVNHDGSRPPNRHRVWCRGYDGSRDALHRNATLYDRSAPECTQSYCGNQRTEDCRGQSNGIVAAWNRVLAVGHSGDVAGKRATDERYRAQIPAEANDERFGQVAIFFDVGQQPLELAGV
jgi:polygalacturonase